MNALALASPVPGFFAEVAAMVVVGASIAYVCHRLRLLPIVGFLVTGVAIGPDALGLVRDRELVDAVAELGVVLLLFTIGIEFSLERLARIQRLILGGGGLQVGLTVLAVAALLAVFGVDARTGIFSGFLVALSSTAIVLKVLGDRGRIQEPAGRFSVGVLILQDLAIIPMVLVVPMLGGGGGSAAGVILALAKGAAIIALVLVVARRLMPPVLEGVARTCSPELFLLSVVAICFGIAWLTSQAGLSLSLGAFLAGLIVSESRFSQHALGEILPLQILFNAAFFMSVGMLLDLSFLAAHLPLVLGAALGVLVLKTLTGAAAARALGEPTWRALGIGVGLAQVGEFSFVLERSGRDAGLAPFGLPEGGAQVLIAVAVILMASTPALLSLGARVARRAEREGDPSPEPGLDEHGLAHLENHVVVAGYGSAARSLVQTLAGARVPMVVVTLSPSGANEAESRGLPVLRGDSSRMRTLQLAGVERAKVLVIPDDEPVQARRITTVARSLNPTLHLAVRMRRREDALELLAAGADQAVAEEFEGIVQLFADVLASYAVAPNEIARHEATLRRGGYAALLESDPGVPPPIDCELDEDCLDRRRFTLRPDAPALGHALRELGLAELGLEALALMRGERSQPVAEATMLLPGDVLELRGTAGAFAAAADYFRPPTPDGEPGTAPPAPHPVDTEAEITLAVDAASPCTHRDAILPVVPTSPGCAECLAAGERWVHLRVCMSCGHVGCCDDSPNRHATAHWHASGHPVMRSLEPGETWGWCFPDALALGGRASR
jgi:CPA2 family monovalent cation:H+ antiporter-2